VTIATKLNRTHLTPGKVAYLLPCLGRTDEDMREIGPQAVSMEDSLSHIYGSIGTASPPGPEVMLETAIVAGIAKATLPPNPKLTWDEWIANYDLIARTFPDKFADFNDRLFEPGGFLQGQPGAGLHLGDGEQQGAIHRTEDPFCSW